MNFRDAMCCLVGADQALQPDALGIASRSRPKRDEVGSLRVDMGNPGSEPQSAASPLMINTQKCSV